MVRKDPKVEAARSRRLAQVAAGILGSCLLGVAVIWMSGSDPEASVTVAPPDPLAARRQAVAAADAETAAEAPPAPQRSFMDPSAAAAVSYTAGDYATAIGQFEEAVKNNPQDAESLSNLGQVLVKLGRVPDSIPYFERACSLNPDRWAYRFNLARALGLMQRWDEAIASYRQAQQLFPNDYVTTFNLGLALHKKGDDAGAVDEYLKAVSLNPDDASFRMALAISYEALQRKPEAAGAYGEYLRILPNAPDAEKVRARIALLGGQTAAPAGN